MLLIHKFAYWYAWNCKKISYNKFLFECGCEPNLFKKLFWKKGLQRFWIKHQYA